MKIKHGIFLMLTILVIILSGFYTFQNYQKQKKILIKGINEKLYTAALMAKNILPADFHDKIQDQSSVSKNDFDQIVDQYNRLCVSLNLEYLWSLMKIDGQTIFTTSTSPDKNVNNQKHANFFEAHSNPELYEKTFTNLKPQYQNNVDKWGKIQVVLIPFKDIHERPYLFGASINLEEVDHILNQSLKDSLFLFFFFLIVGLFFSYLISKFITTPLNKLMTETSEVASGNFDRRINENGFFEQVILSRSFNKMTLELKSKIDALSESETKFRTLFDSMTEMVVLHKLYVNSKGEPIDYQIIDCNKAFTDTTGMEKGDAIGKLATEVYQTETAPYLTEFSHVALTGEKYEYSTYYQPMDKHFHISTVSPRKGHFATVTTDISNHYCPK